LVFVPPPGQPAGTRYAGVVQLLDVAPTLLELAGLPPDPDFRGRSLRPALEGAALADRDAVAELVPADPIRGHTRAVVGPQLRKGLGRLDGTNVASAVGRDPGDPLPQASPAAVPSAQPPP